MDSIVEPTQRFCRTLFGAWMRRGASLAMAMAMAMALVAIAASGQPVNKPEPIRIKAGIKKPLVDAEGNTWLADRGFTGGVIADRDVITPVANTHVPELYRSERYDMKAFSWPVPNGRYLVRLHFAEMYERVTGPGQRIFSFNIEGQDVKDVDIFARTGATKRALVMEFRVDVADGKLDITFTRQGRQYPTISAIEILPPEMESAGAKK